MAPLPLRIVRAFIQTEASGGLVLMASAAVALIFANSPLAPAYFGLLDFHIAGLSVLHWINDALMAGFFLLVGLEIKRELIVGELSTWRRRALPGFAALGGMVVPAVIFVAFNTGDPHAIRGWAIPSATDIAFSLGVLAILGARVPLSLKIFLTALAIIDDLGAVVIIAIFYTADLSPMMIGLAALTVGLLAIVNANGVQGLAPYLALGVVLWVFVFLSGVHATIAGVLLAATIPVSRQADERSPLHRLEHGLAPWIGFGVLPIFGFANAGVALGGLGLAAFAHPITLGTAFGLFFGKQIGVFASAWLVIRLRFGAMPSEATWAQLYGVAILCGIGFTMSLFIGLLAYEDIDAIEATKIGVLAGSIASAVAGWLVLRLQRAPASPSNTR